ncbi:efflux RND transporter periplasmic adaptor subunit [Psychrobium sp. 1_MG-2023]|uniref:efflux RND transporter periplasmic adaptor subunit n=1 Tax=Psychrobium sp. 1_MG-2023 TaxID=3062624 RepID=UPI002695B9E6|nr:HlyD family efflux transporter periplasmic adaptor subunit [Psychrobium sp. 1_MG-2023]MDP2561286.1 HlyD family efflux transporter periplasmic adaptor subunit [Psychrobium sp. 1_MG-2023]
MINGTSGQDEAIEITTTQRWKKYALILPFACLLIWFSQPTLSQWVNGVSAFDNQSLLTASVTKGTLIRDIAVSGKLVAANAPQVYSSEPGQITMHAKPGDNVLAGDIIATLASPELSSLLAQEQSTLARLKIEASRGALQDSEAQLDLERGLDTAQLRLNASIRELKRAELSFKQQVISEIDLVTTQDEKTEAKLYYQHAKKRVELAKKRLEFENKTRQFSVNNQQLIVKELERRQQQLNIRAPVTGIVGNWLVQQKERVSDAHPIMTVVDLSQYEAELNVPEFYADDLGLGLIVNMKIAGKELVGKVISVSPEIKNNQVMVRVSVNANDAKTLRQNQRMNARIEFEKKENVLMVKRGAFLKSSAGQAAYVINEDKALRTPISTGSQSVEYIEITGGLNVGDKIIISDYSDFNLASTIKLNN